MSFGLRPYSTQPYAVLDTPAAGSTATASGTGTATGVGASVAASMATASGTGTAIAASENIPHAALFKRRHLAHLRR